MHFFHTLAGKISIYVFSILFTLTESPCQVTLERARDDLARHRVRDTEREKEREERAKKRAEDGGKKDTVSEEGGKGRERCTVEEERACW